MTQLLTQCETPTHKLPPQISTVAKLDREAAPAHQFTVEASDGGGGAGAGPSTTLVRVVVEDVNDHPPRFTRILSINVTEDTPVGSVLAVVTTVDKDVGVNANVTYTFSDGVYDGGTDGGSTAKFRLDRWNGAIALAAPLDREQQDEYLLKVL